MDNKQSYFNWLVRVVRHPFHDFTPLLWEMFNVEFVSLVPHDDNRIEDVFALRERYVSESHGHFRTAHIPSILEVMITLAERMWLVGYDPDDEITPDDWFWRLIDNLGFSEYYGEFPDAATRDDIIERLEVLVNREYDHNGSGGLFPLGYPEEDQTDVEVYYQMQAWMGENCQ
jgi:hypothetical protein